MCQLLSMSCRRPTDIVFSFTGLATRSREHADGFGVAFFEGKGLRHFVDHLAAEDSPVADFIKHYPIQSRLVLAHIRKATQGQVALQNCHPFVRELWGHYWVFAHNGNLQHFEPKLHAAYRPVGETDSERAFCWLLQELAKSHVCMPALPELHKTLAELVPAIAKHGSFNFVLSQGQALWAHCSTQLHHLTRRHPFGMARLQDEDLSVNFAQHTQSDDCVSVIATQPLTVGEPWVAMHPGQLLRFEDGLICNDGDHGLAAGLVNLTPSA